MLNPELILTTIAGAGFLSGVGAILHFLNTRKPTRSKGSAEAYQAYQQFTAAAMGDAVGQYDQVRKDKAVLSEVRSMLIDLVQDLLTFARGRGATPEDIEPFQDRLDEVRAK